MSRYGRKASFDLEWVERWARRVNEDRILPTIGRFFTSRVMIAFDDAEFLLEVHGGRIVRISEGLTPNDMGFEFALRAPVSAWEKFSQPVPPPMFNDIWAMAHPLHRQLVIDGNQLSFWQNVRALTHMLALMRDV